VTLEDGSKFKGSIDMEPVKDEPKKPSRSASTSGSGNGASTLDVVKETSTTMLAKPVRH
jgi:hypothetical protein